MVGHVVDPLLNQIWKEYFKKLDKVGAGGSHFSSHRKSCFSWPHLLSPLGVSSSDGLKRLGIIFCQMPYVSLSAVNDWYQENLVKLWAQVTFSK